MHILSAAEWGKRLDAVRRRYPARDMRVAGHEWEIMDSGTGAQTLVALPGGLARADASFRWFDRLAPCHRVVAVAYPTTLRTIQELCDGFWLLCDRLNVGVDLLSGGSYSGLIAQGLVRENPVRVGALVLSDTGVPRRVRARWLATLLPVLRAAPLPLVRAAFRLGVRGFVGGMERERSLFWGGYFEANIARMPRAAYLSLLRVWVDLDRRCHFTPTDLAAWPGRVLILDAARDHLFPPTERATLRQLYPQATTHTFPHHSHRAALDLLDEYISLTMRWWEAGNLIRDA